MAVKLNKPIELSGESPSGKAPYPIPLSPLSITGIIVTRAALVEALRIYVPGLADIEVVEDGERFLLTLAATTGPAGPTASSAAEQAGGR